MLLETPLPVEILQQLQWSQSKDVDAYKFPPGESEMFQPERNICITLGCKKPTSGEILLASLRIKDKAFVSVGEHLKLCFNSKRGENGLENNEQNNTFNHVVDAFIQLTNKGNNQGTARQIHVSAPIRTVTEYVCW